MLYIDQIIMFAAGMLMSAVGFGYINLSSHQEWLNRLVWQFKWTGPLLMLIAVMLVFAP